MVQDADSSEGVPTSSSTPLSSRKPIPSTPRPRLSHEFGRRLSATPGESTTEQDRRQPYLDNRPERNWTLQQIQEYATTLRQGGDAESRFRAQRLQALMQNIQQFERTALPLLLQHNWDVAAATAAWRRDSARRREAAAARNLQGPTTADRRNLERGYLAPMTQVQAPTLPGRVPEGSGSTITQTSSPAQIELDDIPRPQPSLQEQITLISVLREVTRAGTDESLRMLLRHHEWDANAAFQEFLRHPNRVLPEVMSLQDTVVAQSSEVLLRTDRESLERYSLLYTEFIHRLQELGIAQDFDVALFVLRQSEWNINRAAFNYQRLEREFASLCADIPELADPVGSDSGSDDGENVEEDPDIDYLVKDPNEEEVLHESAITDNEREVNAPDFVSYDSFMDVLSSL
jgi:hypothetical protein